MANHRVRLVAASLGIMAPLWGLSNVARAENFSNPAVAGYWVESTFDSGGTEGVNAFGAPSVSGGHLVGAIPTDTPTWASSEGGGEGFESVEHVGVSAGQSGASAQYDGTLLGDLTGKNGVTATFSLVDSAIAGNAAFTSGDFGGEDAQGNQAIRLYFKNGNIIDPENDGLPSEWWFNPSPAEAASLSNGTAVTLTADFTNLADWSDIDGHSATLYPTAFEDALGGVTSLGLSLGSGSFYSDGFGFNTGGTAEIDLDSINTTSVPEPTSLGLLGLGVPMLLRRKRRA